MIFATSRVVNSTFGLNADLLESGTRVLVALWLLEDDQHWGVLKKEAVAYSGRTDGC
jgi:hypothetical protein